MSAYFRQLLVNATPRHSHKISHSLLTNISCIECSGSIDEHVIKVLLHIGLIFSSHFITHFNIEINFGKMGDRNMFAESENLIMCSINQDQFHASNALTADDDLRFKGCIHDSSKILDVLHTPLLISSTKLK